MILSTFNAVWIYKPALETHPEKELFLSP